MKKIVISLFLCLHCLGLWAANDTFEKKGNDLLLIMPEGRVKLEFCTDAMFRVRHSSNETFPENEQWMVRKYEFSPVRFMVEDQGEEWIITTDKLNIQALKNPFRLMITDKMGKVLYQELEEQRIYADSVKTKVVLQPDEHFLGFGERMDLSLSNLS